MRFTISCVLAISCVATSPAAPHAAAALDPLVSVWYRGRPAGVPHAEDLSEIRAAGFSAVTWPLSSVTGVTELTRLAEAAGLTVLLRAEGKPLTPASALQPGERADLLVTTTPADQLTAVAWRAIAHGARILSIDAGQAEGAGLKDRAGRQATWVAPAAGIARHLRINGELISQLAFAPPLTFAEARPDGLDVVLLEARKSWVVMATNTSRARTRAVVRMPRDVPYAIWLELLSGANLAMRADPEGAAWNLDLEPNGVRVYVIDKTLK